MRAPARSYLFFVVAVGLWASTPTVAAGLFEGDIHVLVVLTSSGFIAMVTLLAIAAATGRLHEAFSYSGVDWLNIAGAGLLGTVGYTFFYMRAFSLAPPAEVNVVNYLWPLFLVLFAWPILGERLDRWVCVGVILGFLGAAGIFIGWQWAKPEAANVPGYVSAAVGAVFWGLFSVVGKRLPYDKIVSMALYWLVATFVFATALQYSGAGRWPTATEWVQLAFFGVCVNGIGNASWFLALGSGPTALFSNLVYVTPFLSLVYLWIFRHEPIGRGVWLSLVLIVAGCLISLNRTAKSTKQPQCKGE